jgi:serine/threonine protein kinase
MDANSSNYDRTIINTRQESVQIDATAFESSDSGGNALPIGTRLGEFELQEVIGKGGFGIVYLAFDHSLQRRVAIKEYMPHTLAKRDKTTVGVRSHRDQESFEAGLNSFINEAQLLAKFDHPSLVKVHRFWKANGTAYMVMPLYSGPTLREELKRRKDRQVAIDEAWLLELLNSLTQALAVIHADKCYHRDIAPDNILLLEGTGKPLLLDFGAARTVIGDMTQSLTVILKPGYAPIEQYAEVTDMKQGAWTDVYALASCIHCAIRGVTPPPAVGRLMNDSYTALAGLTYFGYSNTFLVAIDEALRVRPADRTQSMNAFRVGLGLPALADGIEVERQQTVDCLLQDTVDVVAKVEQLDTPTKGRSPVMLITIGCTILAGAAAFMYWQFGNASHEAIESRPMTTSQSVTPENAAMPAASPASMTVISPIDASKPLETKGVKAHMEDVLAGQTANFHVTAAPIQPSFRIDRDSLSFSVTSERAGYVQVLWLNADNKLTLLFPNAVVDRTWINANQTLMLPSNKLKLMAAKPEGREYFLVIVSVQARDFSNLSQQQTDGFIQINAESLTKIGKYVQPDLAGLVKLCAKQDCQDYGAAIFSINVIH